jgi:YidC/Oxa1 family membrane protein insertase
MLDFLAPLWNGVIYNPMLNALLLIYQYLPNYGLAIILFTLVIAGLTMPLRILSQKSMRGQQEKQARMKPRLDEIKKKYKDNPEELQKQQMKLYQEEGMINPLNAGCLLTLVPFPIFIGLYSVITSVMGSTPEQLLQLSSHLYPFFPTAGKLVPVNPYFFGLNLAAAPSAQNIIVAALLVVLVVGVQFLQQKMMTLPTAALDPQQAAMNQQMQLIMPLFFGWIVWGTPAGLSLYWITFGALTVIQQGFTQGWGSLATLPVVGSFFGAAPAQPNAKPKKVTPPGETRELPPSGKANGSQANGNQTNGDRAVTPIQTVPTYAGSKKGKKKRGKKS